jgi:hypothetical protein
VNCHIIHRPQNKNQDRSPQNTRTLGVRERREEVELPKRAAPEVEMSMMPSRPTCSSSCRGQVEVESRPIAVELKPRRIVVDAESSQF